MWWDGESKTYVKVNHFLYKTVLFMDQEKIV